MKFASVINISAVSEYYIEYFINSNDSIYILSSYNMRRIFGILTYICKL